MITLLALAVAAGPSISAARDAATPVGSNPPASCPVTIPNGITPPGGQPLPFPGPVGHSENGIYTSFGPDGTVAVSPDMVTLAGVLDMPFSWYFAEGTSGPIRVEGSRLDAPSPPLRVQMSLENAPGFASSSLLFPAVGCWRITAEVGNRSMTFTVWIYVGRPRPRTDWTSPDVPAFCHVTISTPSFANEAALAEEPPGTQGVGNEQIVAYLPLPPVYKLTSGPATTSSSAGGVNDRYSPITMRWWLNPDNVFQPFLSGDGLDGFGSTTAATDITGVTPDGMVTGTLAFPNPGCWRITLQAGPASYAVTVWLWTKELPPAATPVATPHT